MCEHSRQIDISRPNMRADYATAESYAMLYVLGGLTEKAIHLLMETFFPGGKTYGKRHHMILNITSICSS